ncbi:hypothetical protein SMC26_16595 [Actinomadura fulvescens]|uniref:hypothetical protein n=1 Tax=Actinomadura fulvescens TaxID=46160 RepID=UPI0031E20732
MTAPIPAAPLAMLFAGCPRHCRPVILGGERAIAVRLLFIALPLSPATAFALGLFLLGGSSWAVALAIACVVMPVDFAPAARPPRDDRLPRRLRHVLAVESGYNDGIFSPVFAFAHDARRIGARADPRRGAGARRSRRPVRRADRRPGRRGHRVRAP